MRGPLVRKHCTNFPQPSAKLQNKLVSRTRVSFVASLCGEGGQAQLEICPAQPPKHRNYLCFRRRFSCRCRKIESDTSMNSRTVPAHGIQPFSPRRLQTFTPSPFSGSLKSVGLARRIWNDFEGMLFSLLRDFLYSSYS
jgi:hypothetical protein